MGKVNVFIARDGSVIGYYPHTELKAMARAGDLWVDDHYWHEGMEDWMLLPEFLGLEPWTPAPAPPPPQPPTPPVIPSVVLGSAIGWLIALAVVGFFILKPDRSEQQAAATPTSPRLGASAELALRDKAAADLRQRIERLPGSAKPPLNIFYYDMRVDMKKTLSPRTPWSAKIHGWENLMDPATDKTLSRTEFILTTDYEEGAWLFKHYHATAGDLATATSTQVELDENSPTPPSIVGALGLQRGRPATNPPSLLSQSTASAPVSSQPPPR